MPSHLVSAGLAAEAANVTSSGAAGINNMNTDYAVNAPDALILDATGVGRPGGGNPGAAIAKTGANLAISSTGTMRVRGGSGDILGLGDSNGRNVVFSKRT